MRGCLSVVDFHLEHRLGMTECSTRFVDFEQIEELPLGAMDRVDLGFGILRCCR
jgi:hypothetical protein